MGKKLAIKGHSTRGKEVIELLKMMGGKDSNDFKCSNPNRFYHILNEHVCWGYIEFEEIDKYEIFTLEEFLEKYPFKVGDKVYIKVDPNANCLGYDKMYGVIESAMWVEKFGHVIYKLKDYNGIFYKEELHPYKEEVSMDDNKLPSKYYEETQSKRDIDKSEFIIKHMILPNKVDDKLEYEIIDGYEFDKVENNKIILKPIKPKYPTTYDDCCDILNADEFVEYELMANFPKLINARNTYWKIAGEEMGLDKPWEPDWGGFSEDSYPTITKCNGRIVKTSIYTHDCPFAFPSAEMRDAFYENFKGLIEQCKELL